LIVSPGTSGVAVDARINHKVVGTAEPSPDQEER
jgi:hypothetical protein